MTKFYNVVRKDTYEKNGEKKASWKQVGMTLIEKDGKFYLVDDRTGQKYYVFEKEARPTGTAPKPAQRAPSDDFDDDLDGVPF